PGWPPSLAWQTGIDAVFAWRGKAYFFRGSEYLIYDMVKDKVESGPFAITTLGKQSWPASFASDIEAAFIWVGTVYFFKGDECLTYSILSKGVGSPQKIKDTVPFGLTGFKLPTPNWDAQLNSGIH